MATDMDVHFEYRGNAFVWDVDKARSNLRKHGVGFEEAVTVFFDPLFVMVDASRNDDPRDALIGFDAGGRLLYVVHVVVEVEALRLISARRATPEEEALYAQ
ncbi:MAG: BrnT family toxin [Luteimonas sp.]